MVEWKKVLCAGMLCLMFGGCSVARAMPQMREDETLQVVCTIFPLYDWVRNLTDGVSGTEVSLLIQDGTDLHSYQPTVRDIAAIASADIFVYVGGESDTWSYDVLELEECHVRRAAALLEMTGAEAEKAAPGMQLDEHEEESLDEHVWLSPKRAMRAVAALQEILCEMDDAHASIYEANGKAYLEKLENLDASYSTMVKRANQKPVLVADRFPFRYLFEDYCVGYYAAFPGCSAESEASFATIAFLAEQVSRHRLSVILTTESGDTRLARTIWESAERQGEILALDSLQSVTRTQLENGSTYLGRMEANLGILREAMG